MSSRLRQVLAAAAALTLLSGCGALHMRTSNEAGGPIGVGVEQTAGPTPTPTETGPQLPEGYEMQRVDFGGECPVPVATAVAPGWVFPLPPGEYQTLTSGGSAYDGPSISISCREGFLDDNASDLINSREEYSFSDPGSEIVVDRKGQIGNGYYWSFQADLAPSEILAGNAPTMMYGAEIGYTVSGKLYHVSYYASAPKTDLEALAALRHSASYIEIDDIPVTMPQWVV